MSLTSYASTIFKNKFVLYLINGAINTVLTYALFLFFAQFMHYRLAILLVFVIGISIAFVMNAKLVFSRKGSYWLFIAVNLLCLGINLSVTSALVELAHMPKQYAQLVSVLIIAVVGFVLNNRYVFKGKTNAHAVQDSSTAEIPSKGS